MPTLNADQQNELLDLLLEFPGTKTPEQREALLFSLPPQITDSLDLSGDRASAIAKLVQTLEYWGQLTDGRWATEVMLRNALRGARTTQFEARIEAIRQVFDLPAAKATLEDLPEKIASEVSHLMPVGFLQAGYRASRAVARLCVQQVIDGKPIVLPNGRPSLVLGTGWLIAPDLMLTNHHVIAARFEGEPPAQAEDMRKQAERTEAWFDYVAVDKPLIVYRAIALEACDKALDYALLRVSSASTEALPLAEWGWLRVAPESDELTTGRAVNIIQHPAGAVKQIAIRRNEVVRGGKGQEFHYLTDTLPGSSGSPVFNDDWLVVGLHRASRNVPEKVYEGETIKYNNVGVRIHAVLAHLPAALRDEIAQAAQ